MAIRTEKPKVPPPEVISVSIAMIQVAPQLLAAPLREPAFSTRLSHPKVLSETSVSDETKTRPVLITRPHPKEPGITNSPPFEVWFAAISLSPGSCSLVTRTSTPGRTLIAVPLAAAPGLVTGTPLCHMVIILSREGSNNN